METKWTEKQKQCIDARGGTLLVSAAAGSGKTAVLVERIIERVLDRKNPIDIDRMLIVTFTRAAAAEMKDRLQKRLRKEQTLNPNDKYIRRQMMLIHGAQITTVDSFCTDLIREHTDVLKIPSDFDVKDDDHSAVLMDAAIKEVMEEFYADPNSGIHQLADATLIGEKDYFDDNLREMLLRFHGFLRSCAFPDEWMDNQLQGYDSSTPIEETTWGASLSTYIRQTLQDGIDTLQSAVRLAEEDERTIKSYLPSLEDFLLHFQACLESLNTGDWDLIFKAVTGLCSYTPLSLKPVKGDCVSKEAIKVCHKKAKEIRESLGFINGYSVKAVNKDKEAVRPLLETLFSLVRAFDKCYFEKKLEENCIDYGDMEALALKLLVTRENGISVPTPLAKEISGHFDEIYVDEYQDTNETQDAIYMALSRDGNNLFFVGDVKQSIYSFRKARPDLFLKRRNAYTPYDGKTFPATVTLDSNFRSRKEIVDTTNFLFSQIMTEASSEIEYIGGEELIHGATYFPENPESSYATKLILLNGKNLKADMSRNLQILQIGAEIKNCMKHLKVFDKDSGKMRAPEYRDFCILLRNAAAQTANISALLNEMEIPTTCVKTSDFFKTLEIRLIISLLRSIDNPTDDLSLLTIMLSPVGGFSNDDLALLRIANNRIPLYSSMQQYVIRHKTDALTKRLKTFMKWLDKYRSLVSTTPVNYLLQRIYADSDLIPWMYSMPMGEHRVENLHIFHTEACIFEKEGFRGLSSFLTHITVLEKNSQGQKIPGGSGNAVQICTIHGSKGLEYPIVFLMDLDHAVNFKDSQGTLLYHATAGVCTKFIDKKTRIIHTPIMHHCIAQVMRKNTINEEIRIHYVAFTRAREKLFLLGSYKNMSGKIAGFLETDPGIQMPHYSIHSRKSACALDWITHAFARHPDAGALRTMNDTITPLPADFPLELDIVDAVVEDIMEAETTMLPLGKPDLDTPEEPLLPPAVREEDVKKLVERLTYECPYYPLSKISNKLSASEYKKDATHRNIGKSRPEFTKTGTLSATEAGTAVHKFMQLADWEKAKANYESEVNRLLEHKRISQREATFLRGKTRKEYFTLFTENEIYKRIKNSPWHKKELTFSTMLPARTVLEPEALEGLQVEPEDILVQGIVDCVFEENGELIIVDYKTDSVHDMETLRKRYADQMYIYRLSMESIYQKPVRSIYLYSLRHGMLIEI